MAFNEAENTPSGEEKDPQTPPLLAPPLVPLLVPHMGESISQATVICWLKDLGMAVDAEEPLVELETDKITLEVPAPVSGLLEQIVLPAGSPVTVGAVLGYLRPQHLDLRSDVSVQEVSETQTAPEKPDHGPTPPPSLPPSFSHIPAASHPAEGDTLPPASNGSPPLRVEERVPMSPLRQKIAQRLKEAQNTAAILTTFNEIDMSAVLTLREHLKETFAQKHGIKLGLMSFFVRACATALGEIPGLNAEIQGKEIVYKAYCDMGVAVSTPHGLVVPVVRNVHGLDFAGIEKEIARLSHQAHSGTLTLEALSGGTFTLSNGGVYGSLLSTPILNPPQSGILGLHKIQKRAVVVEDHIQIRPMMYVALSYDHRMVDGQQAVTFLVRIKEQLEEPERMLLSV